jgi:hypothetical protein
VVVSTKDADSGIAQRKADCPTGFARTKSRSSGERYGRISK